jgi:hypothetical protein
LLKSNPNPEVKTAFHGNFYLGEIEGKHYMADFHQAMAVDWREYKSIVGKRRWSLDQVSRNKFRVKAGFHFGRPAEEDIAAELAFPWK